MQRLIILLVPFVLPSLQNKVMASDINCSYAGEIFPSPELMRYFICLPNNGSLVAHMRCCEKHKMFNLTTNECEKIPGGGYLDIVINNSTCGGDYIGFKAHPTRPNKYLECLTNSVYVFQCFAFNAVYDETYQMCVVDNTTSKQNSSAESDES